MSSSINEMQHIFDNCPKREVIRFLLLDILYGVNAIIYTSIPFIFYRPQLQCQSSDNQLRFCSEEEACINKNYIMYTDEYPQINSLSMQLDFFCDRKILEAQMVSIQFIGFILSYAQTIFLPAAATQLLKNMIYYTIITGILLFSIQYFQTYIYIAFSFCLWGYLRGMYFVTVFPYIKSSFHGNIPTFGPILLTATFALSSIMYTCFTYFYGHWLNTISDLLGPSYIIVGILLYIFQHKPEEVADLELYQTTQKENSFSIAVFKQRLCMLSENPIYYTNALLFIFTHVSCQVTWTGLVLSLNTLAGSLYANLLLSQSIDFIFNCLTFFLVAKFDLKYILKRIFIIVGFLLLVCIIISPDRETSSNQDQSIILKTLKALPIILGKGFLEVVWSVFYILLGRIVPVNLYQITFSTSNLLCSIGMDLLPFYKYFMEKIGISVFIGYGLLVLMLAYFINSFVYLEKEKMIPLININNKNASATDQENQNVLVKKCLENQEKEQVHQ